MANLRTLMLTTLAFVALNANAQTSADHSAHHPAGAAPTTASAADRMAMMDTHMKSMQAMHDKMANARAPEERQALMAEHMKLMQEGMSMMAGMGPGMGMGAMAGTKGKPGMSGAPMSPQVRQQMMEKRMDMMQSMMQMMMDRMQAMPPASK